MLLTSRPRTHVLFGLLAALTLLPLALGACDFPWTGHPTVTAKAAPTATPRPTAGPLGRQQTTVPQKVSSDPYWKGAGENWHVDKWVVYDARTGAF